MPSDGGTDTISTIRDTHKPGCRATFATRQGMCCAGSVTEALKPILQSVVAYEKDDGLLPGLHQILDFEVIFKGLGLPLDGSLLNKVPACLFNTPPPPPFHPCACAHGKDLSPSPK